MERILIILVASIVITSCQVFPFETEVMCRNDFFCEASALINADYVLTLQQCCLDEETSLSYTIPGIEICFTCIVYGWNTTEFIAKEREEVYEVEIQLRKGLFALQFSNLVYDVVLSQDGNATRDVDFEFTETTVRLNTDAKTFIPFRFILDGIEREPNRTFSLEMEYVSGFSPLVTFFFTDRIEMVVVDGDVPSVNISFELNEVEVREDKAREICVVSLSDGFKRLIPVSITAINGTELESSGNLVEGSAVDLTIDPNTGRACFNLSIIDNNVLEPNKEFTLALSTTDVDAFVIVNSLVVVTVMDDDALTVGWSLENVEVREDDGNISLCANISLGILASPISPFDIVLVSGTAESGTDFLSSSNPTSLSFAPNNQGQMCTLVTLIDDQEFESFLPEYFTAELVFGGVEPLKVEPQSILVTIVDDDVVAIGFSEPELSVDEDGRDFTVCITKDRKTTEEFNVTIISREGTAQKGVDYLEIERSVTLLPEETMACFTSDAIVDDSKALESDETFLLEIVTIQPFNPTRVLVNNASTIIIVDNDDLLLGFVDEMVEVSEDVGSVSVCVNVSTEEFDGPVEVTLIYTSIIAQEGSDYVINDVTLEFSSSMLRDCATVDIVSDSIYETSQQFEIVLSPSDHLRFDRSSVTVVITDDDTLNLGFESTEYSVEEGEGEVEICVLLQGSIDDDISAVDILTLSVGSATSGSDYSDQLTPESLFFTPGGSNRSCATLDIFDDNEIESFAEEDFIITLRHPTTDRITLMPNTAQVFITDNDDIVIGFGISTVTVSEDSGGFTMCIVKNITVEPITVLLASMDGTAKGASQLETGDYIPSEIPSSITLQPEDTSVCFTSSSILDDSIALEEDVSFSLVITGTIPANPNRIVQSIGQVEVVISDNDVVTIGFERSVVSVNESSGEFSVCVVKDLITATPINISLSSIDGTAIGFSQQQPNQLSDYLPSEVPSYVIVQPADAMVCFTSQSIVNDLVALESDVSFFVVIADNVPDDPQRIVRSVDRVEVVIIDDDVVVVGFEAPSITVEESEMEFMMCITKDAITAEPITIFLSSVGGTEEDYIPSEIPSNVTLRTSDTSMCFTSPSILDDSLALETVSFFLVINEIVPDDSRIILDIARVEIIISDDDAVTVGFETASITVSESSGGFVMCIVKNITASPVTTLLSPVDGTAKAISEQQSSLTCEALSSLVDGRRVEDTGDNCTVNKNCNSFTCTGIVDASNDPPVVAVSTYTFSPCDEPVTFSIVGTVNTIPNPVIDATVNRSTLISFNPAVLGVIYITLETTDSGVKFGAIIDGTPNSPPNSTLFPETEIPLRCIRDYLPSEIPLSVTLKPEDTSVCFNSSSITDDSVAEEEDISFFLAITETIPADPRRVILGIDLLEIVISDDDEPPTGTNVNDTVSGDPVLTVPILVSPEQLEIIHSDKLSLCYEIHGKGEEWFNFVSDECVLVNAHYSSLTSILNVIDEIGVKAINSEGKCVDIYVRVQDCSVSVDGEEIEDRYVSGEISIRRYSHRVRISVPNCAELRLVMWIICEKLEFDLDGGGGQAIADNIRFVVMRGLNYGHRQAHGLLGQFWNIPVSFEPYNGINVDGERMSNTYIVNITTSSKKRSYAGFLGRLTWEGDAGPCLYVGDSQSNSIYEIAEPNDGVIEGDYLDYIVPGPFSENFKFGKFSAENC